MAVELKISIINLAFGNSDYDSYEFVESFKDVLNYPKILDCAFLGFQEVNKDSGKKDLPEYLASAGYAYTDMAKRTKDGGFWSGDKHEYQSVYSKYPYTGYEEELISDAIGSDDWERKSQRVLLPAQKLATQVGYGGLGTQVGYGGSEGGIKSGYFRIYHYHGSTDADTAVEKFKDLCEQAKEDGEGIGTKDLGFALVGDMNLSINDCKDAIADVFNRSKDDVYAVSDGWVSHILSLEPLARIIHKRDYEGKRYNNSTRKHVYKCVYGPGEC